MASVTDTLRDRRRWLLLCLGAGFGALFLGVDAIVSQQQFFADYEPVVAEVMEAEVRQVAPGRFVPAVTYRYRLDDSIYRADRPVIVVYLMLVALIFVIINFLVDIVYTLIDPRITLK
jgi:hypothetical protein